MQIFVGTDFPSMFFIKKEKITIAYVSNETNHEMRNRAQIFWQLTFFPIKMTDDATQLHFVIAPFRSENYINIKNYMLLCERPVYLSRDCSKMYQNKQVHPSVPFHNAILLKNRKHYFYCLRAPNFYMKGFIH